MGLFKLQFPLDQVRGYAARFPAGDEDRQRAIGVAARERGWYSRAEFLQVCRWKTARSAPLVAQNSTAQIEAATRIALASGTGDHAALHALLDLTGVGWATASVLLHVAHPERYPIWDVRALQALGINRRLAPSDARWSEYVATYRALILRAGVDGRTLDKGLWQWSVEHGGPLSA
jgi:hypothetical protein